TKGGAAEFELCPLHDKERAGGVAVDAIPLTLVCRVAGEGCGHGGKLGVLVCGPASDPVRTGRSTFGDKAALYDDVVFAGDHDLSAGLQRKGIALGNRDVAAEGVGSAAAHDAMDTATEG